MKILQICNKAPYPANDGSSIAICSLAQGLVDCGADVYLLTVNTKKHFKPDEQVPESFRQQLHYRSVYQNTDTTAIGALLNLFSSQSYFVSRFHFQEFEYALKELLAAHTFDVVQVEGVFMAPYIPLIRRYSKAVIALRTHNVEHQIWERHLEKEKNPLKKWYLGVQSRRLKNFELKAFREADAIIPITAVDAENIRALSGQSAFYTCVTGVDMRKYQPAESATHPNTVFHFAAMDWMPNVEAVEWLMNAVWPLVLKKNNAVKLVLAGRGMPETYKQLQRAGISVIEQVSSSSQFYHDYDIMLVPLWSGSGLRIKLVEGLAYGKPIVATSIGAEGVPYENGTHLVIADTPETFAEAILRLVSDQAYKTQLSHAGRKLAEQVFDQKAVAEGLLKYYKTLCQA